jgi:membrane-associated phospholipid phosphatase
MARAAYVVICLAAMLGFGLFVSWAGHHFSRDSVIGYGLGFMSALVLYYFADKIERREKDQRDRA